MNGFRIALRCETFIALHTFSSKLILLAPSLVVVLQFLLLRLTEASRSARDRLLSNPSFDEIVANNAYGYYVDGLSTGLTMLGLLLVAQAAYSFSFDRDIQTARHLLIRRVSRPSLIMAKLLHLHILGALSCLFLIVVAYLMSSLFWVATGAYSSTDGYRFRCLYISLRTIRHPGSYYCFRDYSCNRYFQDHAG